MEEKTLHAERAYMIGEVRVARQIVNLQVYFFSDTPKVALWLVLLRTS